MGRYLDELYDGAVIIRITSSSYLTVGGEYAVRLKGSGAFYITDDEGDPYRIGEDHLGDLDFVIKDSEYHAKYVEYMDLTTKDSLRFANSEGKGYYKLEVGESYPILRRRTNTLRTVIINSENGEATVPLRAFIDFFETEPTAIMNNIKSLDYLVIADLAIDTKDEEWFRELSEKSKSELQNTL